MVLKKKKNYIRWGIIIASLILLSLFLWNVLQFFDQAKKEERKKMTIWVKAYTELKKNDNPEGVFDPILLTIMQENTTTPMILYTLSDSSYTGRNITSSTPLTQAELKAKTENFKLQYQPIKVIEHGQLYSIVYYGNSALITKLKYFPGLIILGVMLFLMALYYFYTISKSNEQNKLWAGMAKETAHQIGTPLSSLVGWIALLKTEDINQSYMDEMEKDISRLKTITERFSKIGSVPTLKKGDLVAAAAQSFDYLKGRSSKLINFSITKPAHPIPVQLNAQLLSWTIENLVKNASDALKGKGKIHLDITEDDKWAYLRLTDTGKGLAKKDFKRIFKPGETSKKRGWGLGLSLAKRIVEEYHGGKIKVLKSSLGKGTTFEIKLRKFSS